VPRGLAQDEEGSGELADLDRDGGEIHRPRRDVLGVAGQEEAPATSVNAPADAMAESSIVPVSRSVESTTPRSVVTPRVHHISSGNGQGAALVHLATEV
jgi:hypothetical protein